MNGFEFSEVQATKIISVPASVERKYKKSEQYSDHSWPWYVSDKEFFKALGAEFRTIDKREEMLLEDVVYGVEEYVPCSIYKLRTIGTKAIEELRKAIKLDPKYDDEDVWKGPVIHLITGLTTENREEGLVFESLLKQTQIDQIHCSGSIPG